MNKKTVPLTADEIIAGLGLGKRELRKDVEGAIRILSEEMLTKDELAACLLDDPDYDCQVFSATQLKSSVDVVRKCFGIVGCRNNRYFIVNSEADPRLSESAATDTVGKANIGRSVRSLMYEILSQTPLIVGQLAKAIESHADYDGSKGTGKKLLIVVNRILHGPANKKFFERDTGRGRYNVWRTRPGSNPPPGNAGDYQEAPRPQRDALFKLLRSKAIIKGWSFSELIATADKAALDCSSPHSARASLTRCLGKNKTHFEKCQSKNPVRWRAKWLGQVKVPTAGSDSKDLTIKVLTDLGVRALSRKELAEAMHRYGYLFGYQTNDLPLPLLESKVIQAVAGTMYATMVS